METLLGIIAAVFILIIILFVSFVISSPEPKPLHLLWTVLKDPVLDLKPKPKTKKKGIDIRC